MLAGCAMLAALGKHAIGEPILGSTSRDRGRVPLAVALGRPCFGCLSPRMSGGMPSALRRHGARTARNAAISMATQTFQGTDRGPPPAKAALAAQSDHQWHPAGRARRVV